MSISSYFYSMSFFYIIRYSRAHTCMRPSFLTDKIDLYPQCVFSCDCCSSPASAVLLHAFCGSERQESFSVLLFILVMPEHEWISPRPFMHSFCSFLYLPHAQYKSLNQACLCVLYRRKERHSIRKIRAILDRNYQDFPYTSPCQKI